MKDLTDLDIKKMMAEIEFSEENNLVLSTCFNEDLNFRYSVETGVAYGLYNPYEWTRLGPLMVEYEVNINHYSSTVSIDSDYTDRPPIAELSFNDENIGRAICLCILKSKGLV